MEGDGWRAAETTWQDGAARKTAESALSLRMRRITTQRDAPCRKKLQMIIKQNILTIVWNISIYITLRNIQTLLRYNDNYMALELYFILPEGKRGTSRLKYVCDLSRLCQIKLT